MPSPTAPPSFVAGNSSLDLSLQFLILHPSHRDLSPALRVCIVDLRFPRRPSSPKPKSATDPSAGAFPAD